MLQFTNEGYGEYAILSIDGRIIIEGLLENSEQRTISLHHIFSGAYILMLQNDSSFATTNFIVH